MQLDVCKTSAFSASSAPAFENIIKLFLASQSFVIFDA